MQTYKLTHYKSTTEGQWVSQSIAIHTQNTTKWENITQIIPKTTQNMQNIAQCVELPQF